MSLIVLASSSQIPGWPFSGLPPSKPVLKGCEVRSHWLPGIILVLSGIFSIGGVERTLGLGWGPACTMDLLLPRVGVRFSEFHPASSSLAGA